MAIVKDIEFEVTVKQKKTLSFHEIIGFSWNSGQKIVTVTLGSWEDKGSYGVGDPAEQSTSIIYKPIATFEDAAKVIDTIISDPGSIFNGGTKDGG